MSQCPISTHLSTGRRGPTSTGIYDSDRARLGYLPNYARVFGLRPAAEPDSHYRTSLEPDLLQVLTVGRPVEIDYSAKPRIRRREFNQFLE